MRIRQVRPEFWNDEDVAAWPVPVRLFYIGLWCVCDDAGYFEHVPSRIAALIYPYEPRKRREDSVAGWLAFLAERGKVTRFEGCEHAVVPTLTLHQKVGGTASYVVRNAHEKEGELAKTPLGFQVFERDDYRCRYCGERPEPSRLILEHVINRGPTTLDNLVAACRSCNRKKSNKTLEEAGMTLLPVPIRESPENPVSNVTLGNGKDRGGTGGTAPTEGSARPFNGMMPPFEKLIGGKAS